MKMQVFFLNRKVARKAIQMQNKPHMYLFDWQYGLRILGVYSNAINAWRALDRFGLRGVGCIGGACKFFSYYSVSDADCGEAAKELLNSTDPKPIASVAIGGEIFYFGFFEDIHVIVLKP